MAQNMDQSMTQYAPSVSRGTTRGAFLKLTPSAFLEVGGMHLLKTVLRGCRLNTPQANGLKGGWGGHRARWLQVIAWSLSTVLLEVLGFSSES